MHAAPRRLLPPPLCAHRVRAALLALLALVVVAPPAAGRTPSAPVGMVAVAEAAGPVGAGAAQRDVSVGAFFIDATPATNGELAACAADGACPATSAASQASLARVQKAAKAEASAERAAEVTWELADAYCVWSGKRLPSEAEWERAAARGAIAADAERGGDADAGKGAKKAQSRAKGPREWTSSWFVLPSVCQAPLTKIAASSANNVPLAQCGTHDPLDPCDSAHFCGTLTQKVHKDPAAATARAGGGYLTKTARVRCASSTATLATFPSVFVTQARAPLAIPSPPTAEELAVFNAVREDVLDTPLCDEGGRSYANCRDPRSYLKTNEPRLDVVVPYVKDLGGGYTGVGSDQGYTYVALAKSRWAWLFDYDPNVVNWHKVLRQLVLASPTRAEFIAWFDAAKLAAGAKLLKDAGEPRDVVALYRSSGARMKSEYVNQSKRSFTWLGSDDAYAYIRAMYQQGRMKAFRGNMLDVNAMKTIGDAATKLGVPMRIYYPSNAPEFWMMSKAYRDNVKNLPFDAQSIVVQTISSVKTGYGQKGYWHYNVHLGTDHQRVVSLPGYQRARQLFYHRTKTDTGELTTTALPAAPASP